jgi:hypothetical protein
MRERAYANAAHGAVKIEEKGRSEENPFIPAINGG